MVAFRDEFGYTPELAIVVVGADAPSLVYLRKILDGCERVGLVGRLVELEGECTADELGRTITALGEDPHVAGIIVQQPLPDRIPLRVVLDTLDPRKDIDGIHPLNAGLLALGYEGYLPATAHASVELLKRSGIELAGKHAVVVGRSNVIGKPVAQLLLREHATVTLCHSRTRDLPAVLGEADVVVVAIGRAGFVSGEMLKDRGRRGGRRHQRHRRGPDGRRRLRVRRPGGIRHHAGARWRRPPHQRHPADPPHACRS